MEEINAVLESALESVVSGVDWLTYVAPRGEHGERLLRLGYGIVEEQTAAGAKTQPFGGHGYRGEQTTSAAVGERDDGTYLRLSGGLACSKWGEIGSCGGHPTRLDVQTTFQLRQSWAGCGARMFSATQAPQARRGRPPLYSFSTDTRGAWIGRAGSRSSRAYLRVYDKGQESGTAPVGTLWRIEAELKREYAEDVWRSLQRAPDAGTYCYASSAFWARRCGLDWLLPTPSEDAKLTPPEATTPPDVAESLQWLRVQIRPTVQRLTRAGYESAVLRALGLELEQLRAGAPTRAPSEILS
jgi:hypothetical protein